MWPRGERAGRDPQIRGERHVRLQRWRLRHVQDASDLWQVAHGRCSAAVLLAEEKECGWFLSCQARALSDLTIELSAANKYHVRRSWPRLSLLDS
jgi:hypothetical protein